MEVQGDEKNGVLVVYFLQRGAGERVAGEPRGLGVVEKGRGGGGVARWSPTWFGPTPTTNPVS